MAGTEPSGAARRIIWVNRFFLPDESATSIMLTDLVRELASQGLWHHHLVTSNASYALYVGGADRTIPRVVVHRIPAIGSNNKSLLVRLVNFALFYVGAIFYLLRHLRRDDVVISLTDPPLIGVVSTWTARLKGAHSVHWVQDIFPETASRLGIVSEGGFFDRILRRMRNASWHRASASVTIGENMRDYLHSNGVPDERVRVIQNWAGDESILPVAPDKNNLRHEWSYANHHCVVGYSGNLGRAHEIETKIAAIRHLHERGVENIRFLFIGGGAKQADLRQAVRALPEELVDFRPYQPMHMLAQSLSVPDVHWISLQPNLEGLIVPSKLYGVLAVGRPVIFVGHAKGEVARLLAEAECGATFSPGESSQLADYLAELSENADLRRQLGVNGRDYLEANLRRTGRLAQWGDLINSLG